VVVGIATGVEVVAEGVVGVGVSVRTGIRVVVVGVVLIGVTGAVGNNEV
jgi:hypothetical protein